MSDQHFTLNASSQLENETEQLSAMNSYNDKLNSSTSNHFNSITNNHKKDEQNFFHNNLSENINKKEKQGDVEETQTAPITAPPVTVPLMDERKEHVDNDVEENIMRSSPLVVLVIGMAGTGKTTLVQQLQRYSAQQNILSYFMNLDPAVAELPYNCNIDICDTVKYKEVMKQYRLGPNGAIMTSLNLFATKFHQVITLLERRRESLDLIVVDTPGQIEVFTWSASGQLIMEAFSSTFPTCVLFVGDTTRCMNPQTFMSTMMYSSSIMFKSQLPLLLAFNKIDITSADKVMRWVRDQDDLSDALANSNSTYAETLTQSLALFVNEFYNDLPCLSLSAARGDGISELVKALYECKQQYIKEFLPLIEERKDKVAAKERRRVEFQIAKMKKTVGLE